MAKALKLSEFHKGGRFFAFRKMIAGEVFYFGAAFGVTDTSGSSQLRAATAAEAVATYAAAQGIRGDWTDEQKATARREALAALAGFGQAPQPVAAPAAAALPTVAAIAPAAPSTVAASGLMVHAAIDLFLAELKERVATKEVGLSYYEGLRVRFLAVKKAWADRPLAACDREAITAAVNYWKKRPQSYKGKPVAVETVYGRVAAIGTFFRWAYNTEKWDGFRAWELLFKVDRDSLLTPKEKKQKRDGKPTFTVDELATLYKYALPRMRLYMLLGLNCGMGQTEIATLRDWDLQLDAKPAMIDRERNKTGVKAKWELWDESAELLNLYCGAEKSSLATFKRYMPEYSECIRYKRNPAYAPEVGGDIEDIESLALRTEDGYPLVHRSGAKGARTDSVYMALKYLYRVLAKEEAKAKAEGREFPKVRKLGFYAFRDTSAQMVRDIAGYETHKVFLAHATLEASGRKSVSEAHYTARTQADFDKVAAALREMRAKLAAMFPKQKKGKAA